MKWGSMGGNAINTMITTAEGIGGAFGIKIKIICITG